MYSNRHVLLLFIFYAQRPKGVTNLLGCLRLHIGSYHSSFLTYLATINWIPESQDSCLENKVYHWLPLEKHWLKSLVTHLAGTFQFEQL